MEQPETIFPISVGECGLLVWHRASLLPPRQCSGAGCERRARDAFLHDAGDPRFALHLRSAPPRPDLDGWRHGGGWTVVAGRGCPWRWRWRWRWWLTVAAGDGGGCDSGGGGCRRWYLWRRWLKAIIRLTVRRRQRRYVEVGKGSGGREGVRVRARRNRGRKPCRAIWPADNGDAVWRRSPPWRRCFSIPLSFPYHILRVKTLLRFRTSGGGYPCRILLEGTALEKSLRVRILSLVYALASNFSPRL
uniref:Uncharacterized protein n=1 Tax=Oryza rufipogon TaxID=4529 RepID=A0A0E0N1W7_ORYRU